MKKYNHYLTVISILFIMFLSSCSMFKTKTFEDNVALFELGYKEAGLSIKSYTAAGLIVKGSPKAQKIKSVFENIKEGRRLLYLAIVAGDISTAEGQLAAAVLALTALQTQYLEKAKQEKK